MISNEKRQTIVAEDVAKGRNLLPEQMQKEGFVLIPNLTPFFTETGACIAGTQHALTLILTYDSKIVGTEFSTPTDLLTNESTSLYANLAETINTYVHLLMKHIGKKIADDQGSLLRAVQIVDGNHVSSWHVNHALISNNLSSATLDKNRTTLTDEQMDGVANLYKKYQEDFLNNIEQDPIASLIRQEIQQIQQKIQSQKINSSR